MQKLAILLLCVPVLAPASDKQAPPVAQATNNAVALSATLYDGKDAVRAQLGSDLGGYFIVVKVELTPKGPKPLVIDRDDFVLRSYNNGEKCQPYAPSQIAGRASLAVVPASSGGVGADRGGPVFGVPGLGMPQQLPGQGGSIGSTTAGVGGVEAKVDDGGSQKDDPVLAVLKARVLPEKQTTEPVSGLLYFSIEGKHKPKDLTLQYKTPQGLLTLSFR